MTERSGFQSFVAIHLQDVLRFSRHVHQIRDRRLHSKRHLVLSNPCLRLRISQVVVNPLVHGLQTIEHHPSCVLVHAARIGQIQYGIALSPECDSGVSGRKKSTAPQPRIQRLATRLAVQHHELRKIAIQAAQAVTDPCSQGWPAGNLIARLNERDRRVVIDGLRPDRVNRGCVIGHRSGFRQQLTHPLSAVSIPAEAKHGRGNGKAGLGSGHIRQSLHLTDRLRQIFVGPVDHLRLVVQRVQMRRCSGHEQPDHPLGARREMLVSSLNGRGAFRLLTQQTGQRRRAQAFRLTSEELSSRFQVDPVINGMCVHGGFPNPAGRPNSAATLAIC